MDNWEKTYEIVQGHISRLIDANFRHSEMHNQILLLCIPARNDCKQVIELKHQIIETMNAKI
jgi:hypothetical protein